MDSQDKNPYVVEVTHVPSALICCTKVSVPHGDDGDTRTAIVPVDPKITINSVNLNWRLEICNDREDPYFKLTYLSDFAVKVEIRINEYRDEYGESYCPKESWLVEFKRGSTHEFPYYEMTYRDMLGTIEIETPPYIFSVVSLGICQSSVHLSRQLAYANLLGDGKFSDATLVLDENNGSKEFAVHRAILAAHSSYFAELFEQSSGGDAPRVYKLDKVTDYTLRQLLKFVYTGDLQVEVIYLAPLCAASVRFAVDQLTKKCCEVVEKILTKETVIDILNQAETYDAADLRDVVIKFMLTKYPEMMAQSPKLREYAAELADIVRNSLTLK